MQPHSLTLTQAAERAGVTTSALRHAIRLGRLPAERIGARMWLVTAANLDTYRASRAGGIERKAYVRTPSA